MTDRKQPGPGQRATALAPEKARQERHIAALRREREGYVTSDKKDRAKAVDAELKRLGADDSDDKPKGRTAAKKSTAAAKDSD